MVYTLLQFYFHHPVPSLHCKCLKNRSCEEISLLHYCKLGTYVYNVFTNCFIFQGLEYIMESKFRQNTFNQHILRTHIHTCLATHMRCKKGTHYLDMFHTRMIIFDPSSFQYIIQPSTRPCCITNSCWSPGQSFYWLYLHSLYYMSG